jgi:hypothetical protein
MQYEIVWGGDPEDLLVTTRGTATLDELSFWIREAICDPRYRPGMRVLVDHREVDWSGLTPEDIRTHVAAFTVDAERIGHSYCAMVMGKPVDFGIARMKEQYAEADPTFEAEIQVFASVDDARRWLGTVPAPADA